MTVTATTKKAVASPKKATEKSPKSVKKAIASPTPKASPKSSPPPKSSPKKEAPGSSSPKKRPASAASSTKPKKAATAYFIWLGEVGRAKAIKEKCGGSGSDVAAVSRAAGEFWGKMSDAEKKPFQARAEKDKLRYAKEMESYVPSEDEPAKKKKGKKGKKEKDPNKPKKPMSAYMAWLKDNRAELSKDPSVVKVTDVMKIAGEKWKTVDAATKAKYEKLAEAAKATYDKAIAEYKASKGDDDDDDDDEE